MGWECWTKGWEWKFREVDGKCFWYVVTWMGSDTSTDGKKSPKLRGRGVSVITGADGVCVIRYLSHHQAFKSMAGLKALCVCVSGSLLMKLL